MGQSVSDFAISTLYQRAQEVLRDREVTVLTSKDRAVFLRLLDGRTIRASGNSNLAYFRDPGYNRRLDSAMGLRSPAREVALGRLAVDVARTAAPWAAVANDRTHDFFSPRIGCQRWNALSGLDLGSLCIRSGA